MNLSPVLLLFVYSLLVLLAALAGGWVIMALKLNHTRLQIALSAVAGLMLGIAMLHFIPHAIHHNHSVDHSMQWALCGFLLMFFLQRLFHYHHHTAEHEMNATNNASTQTDGKANDAKIIAIAPSNECVHGVDYSTHSLSWMGTTIGLSLHSLVDGVALATAVYVSDHVQSSMAGLGVALAVILHKPFGAMAISTLMMSEGCSRFLRQLVNVLFALITPIGALLFFLGADHFIGANEAFQGNALAFCAGTFLCIACADLLPELQFHSHDRVKLSLALAAGLALAVLLGKFGHSHSVEHQHDQKTTSASAEPQ